MHFFGCLIALFLSGFLLLVAFGLSLLDFLLRLLGIRRPRTIADAPEDGPNEPASQKRVFDDDEGEYVDFEEV
ncbi:MAG: DUF4834 family protein [Bacteroidaceae bacterium]|nr:DUF4834 family protein [Bacteroidaceae bacterium]